MKLQKEVIVPDEEREDKLIVRPLFATGESLSIAVCLVAAYLWTFSSWLW